MRNVEPSLPSNRTFVVQFRSGPDGSELPCSGQVVHLISGRTTQFESWEKLQEIVSRFISLESQTQF